MVTRTQVQFASAFTEAVEMILESVESKAKIIDIDFSNGGVRLVFSEPVPPVVKETMNHFASFLKAK